MLKSPSLPKLLLCLLFWLSTGLSMRVNGQDLDDGFYEESGRGDSFGGERFGGFRGRGGFRGGPRGNDFEGGGFGGGEGRFGRDWGDEEGGRWGGRGGFRGGFGNREGGEMNAASGGPSGTSSGSSPRPRITVDLPQSFLAGDQDRDGQIGLYEWRQWRRGDMAGFLALDHNGDGFLTPAELIKGPRSASGNSGASQLGLVSAETAPTSGDSGTGMGTTGTPAGGGAPSVSGDSPEANRAASMFRLLDSNHNGQLDPDEWGKAKTIRGQFEAAKIDLSGAMSKEDFVKNFVTLNKKP